MPRWLSELARQLAGRRALLPRSDRAADDLPAALRRARATVTEVVAYRTAETESLDAALLEVIRGGGADAVTFFSPSAFEHFARVLGSQALRETGARVAFAAVGPVTASPRFARAGLPVAVEAREATASSLVAALERYFAPREAEKAEAALMSFPIQRPRRLRRSEAIRGMVRETRLSTQGFIYPMFACPGTNVRLEVGSMPGVFQHSPDRLVEECREVEALGIPAVMLFGLPESKDERGSEAWSPVGVVQRAIEAIRRAKLNLVVITDVCLCEYTSHGHCGVIENGSRSPTILR